MAANAQYVFSTGRLYARDINGAADDDVEFAVLNNISVDHKSQKKELFAPPQVSMFPVAAAFFGANLALKAAFCTINADALRAVTGMEAAGTDPIVLTAPKVFALPVFQAVFEAQDVNGKTIKLTCANVRAPGVQIPFRLEDFTMPDVDLEAYPDAEGNVGTWEFGA